MDINVLDKANLFIIKSISIIKLFQDWSVKYDQEKMPVQPRYDINAPDLYLPTMGFITYIFLASLLLGKICFIY